MSSVNTADVESTGYAVYVLNVNRYHVNSDKSSSNPKSLDTDQSNISLSLLGTNLEAEQETLVRCHIQKTLSASESVGFKNEGRCLQVKTNDESEESFGCYYHHLVRDPASSECSSPVDENFPSSKKTSYFICLTGDDAEVLNSFCPELGIFCNQLLPYLEPQEQLLEKLKPWYFSCIQYIERCIENFKDHLMLLFQAALHHEVTIECEDASLKWDLERFVDACSLTNLFQSNSKIQVSETGTECHLPKSDSQVFNVQLKVIDTKLICVQELNHSVYCQKWVDELLLCGSSEHLKTRNVLEMFRLKTVRDVNTMMRLLKKAENDYYSLFKAYQFYNISGYGDILLWHVKQEAILASHEEVLDTIASLSTFIANKSKNKVT